jgi:hypothetical protein
VLIVGVLDENRSGQHAVRSIFAVISVRADGFDNRAAGTTILSHRTYQFRSDKSVPIWVVAKVKFINVNPMDVYGSGLRGQQSRSKEQQVLIRTIRTQGDYSRAKIRGDPLRSTPLILRSRPLEFSRPIPVRPSQGCQLTGDVLADDRNLRPNRT